MIKTVGEIAEAYDAGRYEVRPFLKVWPSAFATAAAWYDGTLSGTYPRASYYPGDDYAFSYYPSGTHLSHYHGGNVTPYQKAIKSLCVRGSAAGVSPCHYVLCDFLGYYQGISWETMESQPLTNANPLTRYTDGKGVQAFFVQLFGRNASSVATMTYVNAQDNMVTSPDFRGNTLGTGATQNAQVAGTYLPFVQLGAGETGIKRVVSVDVSSMGTGIAVLVLVKPLCEIICRDTTYLAPYEIDFFQDRQKMPIVKDGACLNWLVSPSATMASLSTIGYIEYIWG